MGLGNYSYKDFKVGDKVKVIKEYIDKPRTYRLGEILTVTSVGKGSIRLNNEGFLFFEERSSYFSVDGKIVKID
jgi:hypothetical protein